MAEEVERGETAASTGKNRHCQDEESLLGWCSEEQEAESKQSRGELFSLSIPAESLQCLLLRSLIAFTVDVRCRNVLCRVPALASQSQVWNSEFGANRQQLDKQHKWKSEGLGLCVWRKGLARERTFLILVVIQ